MANEERLKGPNASDRPDHADEVQRHTVAPTPPAPPRPSGQSINEIEQTPRDATKEDASAPARAETLFPAGDITRLRNQWTDIQAAFVDEPRNAVQRADSLVGDVL